MAIEHELQALMLAEAHEEIQAYEAWSHKSLQGLGWPKAMKPLSPGFVWMPIGLDYSSQEFWQRGKGINGSAPMITMVTKPQDESPWTRIVLPQADSSLEDWSRVQDGDKALISLGITQKTVSLILSPWLWWLSLKPALLERGGIGSKREPLITNWIKRTRFQSWMTIPALMTSGYSWLMLTDTSILDVPWMP